MSSRTIGLALCYVRERTRKYSCLTTIIGEVSLVSSCNKSSRSSQVFVKSECVLVDSGRFPVRSTQIPTGSSRLWSTSKFLPFIDSSECSSHCHPSTEEVFKSASYLPDVVLSNTSKTAFSQAHNYDGKVWDAYRQYPSRLQRFGMILTGYDNARPQNRLFKGTNLHIVVRFRTSPINLCRL